MRSAATARVARCSQPPAATFAQGLPSGFQRTDPIDGRDLPTGVYFAHDGRVFVTEKSGAIWVYRNLLDTAPTLFADLSAEIHTIRRPRPARLRARSALSGSAARLRAVCVQRRPLRRSAAALDRQLRHDAGTTSPDPPAERAGGCVIGAHLSRLDVVGDVADTANETVLIEDWYQFFPSHSIGTLLFGADGYLYAGGGDGASYNWADWGQGVGNPDFPDQRSPTIGGVPEGGALRSQGSKSKATTPSQQVWLDGAILRLNPATGEGAPDNPLAATRSLRKRATHHRVWPAQSVPLHRSARHRRDLGRRRRLEHVGRSEPHSGAADDGTATLRQLRLAVLRRPRAHGGLRQLESADLQRAVCERRHRRPHAVDAALVHVRAHGELGHHGPRVLHRHVVSGRSTRIRCSSPTTAARSSSTFRTSTRTATACPIRPPTAAATAFYGGFAATAVQLTIGPGADIFFPNINLGTHLAHFVLRRLHERRAVGRDRAR